MNDVVWAQPKNVTDIEDIEIHYHEQLFKGVNAKLYTMVGHRK
jgi:hypothetical protein